ncbi:uncharacterized protein LOC131225909 [Magnolia sinica]|uniref:uncharacterized protein LOC131225909 n=1 Tax=Magnolia sinica TaxID=86752 RepID=UPI00265B04B2|nr:uncharacterized protein LOC131225909 [Magnolia sinica]
MQTVAKFFQPSLSASISDASTTTEVVPANIRGVSPSLLSYYVSSSTAETRYGIRFIKQVIMLMLIQQTGGSKRRWMLHVGGLELHISDSSIRMMEYTKLLKFQGEVEHISLMKPKICIFSIIVIVTVIDCNCN